MAGAWFQLGERGGHGLFRSLWLGLCCLCDQLLDLGQRLRQQVTYKTKGWDEAGEEEEGRSKEVSTCIR